MVKAYSGVGRSGLQRVLAKPEGAPSLISFLIAFGIISYTSLLVPI
jgi:hypothetical protein